MCPLAADKTQCDGRLAAATVAADGYGDFVVVGHCQEKLDKQGGG